MHVARLLYQETNGLGQPVDVCADNFLGKNSISAATARVMVNSRKKLYFVIFFCSWFPKDFYSLGDALHMYKVAYQAQHSLKLAVGFFFRLRRYNDNRVILTRENLFRNDGKITSPCDSNIF